MKILAYLAAAFVVCVLIPVGCSRLPSSVRARHAAESIGLNDVRVVGRRPAWGVLGGCKNDDVTLFHVVGTANGRTRHIDICAPLIGGYTVRG